MNRNMKNRYRVFRRGWGTFYCEDLVTKKQTTLGTRDKDEAYRLVAAKNETEEAPAFSLHLARVYWKAGDPAAAQRTWQHVMDEIPKLKTGETQHRWLTAIKDKALGSIRNMVVLETQAEHFLKVLENGSISSGATTNFPFVHSRLAVRRWTCHPSLVYAECRGGTATRPAQRVQIAGRGISFHRDVGVEQPDKCANRDQAYG
jgi:hypothetical protein